MSNILHLLSTHAFNFTDNEDLKLLLVLDLILNMPFEGHHRTGDFVKPLPLYMGFIWRIVLEHINLVFILHLLPSNTETCKFSLNLDYLLLA